MFKTVLKQVSKKKINKKKLILLLLIMGVILFASVTMIVGVISGLSTLRSAAISWVVLNMNEDVKVKEIEDITQIPIEDYPSYGVYPTGSLKTKVELLEACKKVGEIYDIPAEYILGVMCTEISVDKYVEAMQGKDLKRDICDLYSYAADGSSFMVKAGSKTDAQGNKITDPLRVGKLRSDFKKKGVAKAIGVFQFNSTYIQGHMQRMYIEKDGKPGIVEGVEFMSFYDEQLGMLRPNPFYFYDAAVNCAYMIKNGMVNHNSFVADLSVPERAKKDILFIYSCDSYHGETAVSSKGEEAKKFHNAWGKMYGQIFNYLKDSGVIKESLCEMSDHRYNREILRLIIGGTIKTKDPLDYTGEFTGEYKNGVEYCGKVYNKTLLETVSNTEPYNINYKNLMIKMRPGSGTRNKFGFIYGMQALNEGHYYMGIWYKELEEYSESGIGEGTYKIPGELPFVADSNSRKEMMKAAISLVGKSRYVFGGGHLNGSINGTNPLWRLFSSIYVKQGKLGYCIPNQNKKVAWCPVHGSGVLCKYNTPNYKNSTVFLNERNISLNKYGAPYKTLNNEDLDKVLGNTAKGRAYHSIEGLDCSGFVSWVYNQTLSNRTYDGSSQSFIGVNGLTTINKQKLLPGDVVVIKGHIVMVVGQYKDNERIYLTIEATPPEVRFGLLYLNSWYSAELRDKNDMSNAEQFATNLNKEFGGIPYEHGKPNKIVQTKSLESKVFRVGRPAVSFIDAGTFSTDAEEIIDIVRREMPQAYLGR
jgi:cell wall-associated NlpC family hydrolase